MVQCSTQLFYFYNRPEHKSTVWLKIKTQDMNIETNSHDWAIEYTMIHELILTIEARRVQAKER